MVLSDRALATSYRLSTVTIFSSAAVCPQFLADRTLGKVELLL